MSSIINSIQSEWRQELDKLPTLKENQGKIPSFFLAHGQPLLIYPSHLDVASSRLSAIAEIQGPTGTLANFLRDLGPVVLEKYAPKAIVVFSAHWESEGEVLVSDWDQGGAKGNPLLYDFFGFPKELYETKFESRGDGKLSRKIVDLLKEAKIPARLSPLAETRGKDGRGFEGVGLDHGVFVPFKLMFGDVSPVPIVQISLNSSLLPQSEYDLGEALSSLRSEGVLIISGGLTIHTFDDFGAFNPNTAGEIYKNFEKSIIEAVEVEGPNARKSALFALTAHAGFRLSHPREEHFVPLYVAAGAASNSDKGTHSRARVLAGMHGAKTVVFGI